MTKNAAKIIFLGGGNMATALISGLVGKLYAAEDILVLDPNPVACARLEQTFGVSTLKPVSDTLTMNTTDVLVLATKPQQLREAMHTLYQTLDPNQLPLLISIAAGIRAHDLSQWFGGHRRIVRTMPNTPALIGAGITAMTALSGVSENDKMLADTILSAVGETLWLDDETLLDSATALSGSGPAYVFYFLEALCDGALELGLTAEQGKQLALATFLGASKLAAQSSESPQALREHVTSAGGTTAAALASMAQDQIKPAIVRALHAAHQRSIELGDAFGHNAPV